MTRRSLTRTLRRSSWLLVAVLAISLASKLADHIPGVAGGPIEKIAKDLYEFLKDMALVFVTVVAAYLASVFQKRQQFVTALQQEWREIIHAKSALFTYTQLDAPTQAHYLAAFCAISETIDNMRTVYSNVGETKDQIGLYPFAPLHDMRRAFQTLEPKSNAVASPEARKLARDAILQSFYALRENFLDELDLEAPDKPLLIFGGRRMKQPGAEHWARLMQDGQRYVQDKNMPGDPKIQAFLTELYDKEHTTEKPWRQVVNGANGPNGRAGASNGGATGERQPNPARDPLT